jgi:SAM-dependent methyltransferase
VIRWLDRVIPAPTDPYTPNPNRDVMQRISRETAFEPDTWTPERAAKVGALFNDLAPGWNQRAAAINRYDALEDALARGDVGAGPCLEVGSGTGLVTKLVRQQFAAVVSLDLSLEMLRLGSGARVLADSSVLPFGRATFDTLLLVNMFLFPGEVDRVLALDGALVWVSTVAQETPIYLPPEDVAEALPGTWSGVAADAGRGRWTVLRRA